MLNLLILTVGSKRDAVDDLGCLDAVGVICSASEHY